MGSFKSKFVLDVNILLDFLLEREGYTEISKVIEYLVKNKRGYISASSLLTLYYIIAKQRKTFLPFLPKILEHFFIWKVPSYIDWSHPLAQKDIEDYLIHLTAEALGAFVITRDKEFLELSNRAITIEEFFKIIQKEKKEEKIAFLDLPLQVSKIYPEVEEKWDDILASAGFVCGKYVKEFEEKFAEYLRARFCIGVNSGTSALIVALMAIGLKPEDEVIMPVNTFIATAEAVSVLGGKPVFVDVHPEYYTIDVTHIEHKITKKTKAIIPVHLYGQCADMDPIMEIAKKYNLWVIEDACQAHGAEYKGQKAGTIGHMGCFSFYPGKNLGAWGEAGACVTNNERLAEKMYMIRNHGGVKKYQHNILGGNFRMEELQGAVLIHKLKFLDIWNQKRREVANLYNEKFKNTKNIIPPKEAKYNKHVYHQYIVRLKNRNFIKEYLEKKNITTSIHYPTILSLENIYKRMYEKEKFPTAFKISNEILSLPIYPEISLNDVNYIAQELKKII